MNHFVDAIAFDARSHSLGGGGGNGNFATTSKEWKFMEEGEEGDIMDDLASGRTRTPSTKTVRSCLFFLFFF